MAHAVAAGGMRLIEITWNSAQAAVLIKTLRSELPDCTVGSGTLLTQQHMQDAIAAGSQFLFTPHLDTALIRLGTSCNIPVIPGTLTPTEIVTAWQAGASSVKVFPIQAVGGAAYLRLLQGPLGQIPLIPTGGVTLDNAADFLEAGAIAVGISSDLFPPDLITAQDWEKIADRARDFVERKQKLLSRAQP
jgi:2-dehydro-3-deoxyphosphogluconate aldolase / (4S)-4-hydroxy-2-oxoglutarate aldolase